MTLENRITRLEEAREHVIRDPFVFVDDMVLRYGGGDADLSEVSSADLLLMLWLTGAQNEAKLNAEATEEKRWGFEFPWPPRWPWGLCAPDPEGERAGA